MSHASVPLRALLRGLALAAVLLAATGARALVRFDFEQKFYVHPGYQTWDFSLVRDQGVYHLFYHAVRAIPSPAPADSIWHATSPDLAHWQLAGPVLASGTAAWDTAAVWAPDVVRDAARDRWVMAYTGVDASRNQWMGLAYSDDLDTWTREPANPVLWPDPDRYLWGPERVWSDFRDPFLWREGGRWHVILTAAQWLDGRTGVLFHATSDDLLQWQDVGVLFAHDGAEPDRVLESPQYHVLEGWHHLLFGEFDTVGASHVPADSGEGWTMADRTFIDNGYAPELDSFDPGVRLISRIAPFMLPAGDALQYVIRIDTLLVDPASGALTVHRPHPLDADWEVHTGTAADLNPVFGDNPVWRDEPGTHPVGHGWFGSGEAWRGPLGGVGYPGASVGGVATCELLSRPFVVEGDSMSLHVGGAQNDSLLHVALVDAATDSILRLETGRGTPVMDRRAWYLGDLRGRLCRVRIRDAATGPGAFLNVDEIVEFDAPALAAAAPTAGALTDLGAFPNPGNPRVRIAFTLTRAARVGVRILDLRGREVWRARAAWLPPGPQSRTWEGRDAHGRAVASGVYLYRVEVNGRPAGGGKLSLLR